MFTTSSKIIATSALFAVALIALHAAADDEARHPQPQLGLAFTELPPSIPELRFAFACQDGLKIDIRWIAENVGDAAPADFVIAQTSLVTRGPLNIASLSRPTKGWPQGLYRLELVQNEQVFHTERYVIEQPRAE